MENEIWKDIIGYEGKYQVSSFGNVKNLNYAQTKIEKIMPCRENRGGYLVVYLCKNGGMKTKTIHSLVGMHFIDKDYKLKGLVVNHINFNKKDNRLANLEIITTRENSNRKHIPSTSKYTGVCWDKKSKRWISGIVFNGSRKYLGSFVCEKEASVYYENALACINEGRIGDIKVKERNKTSKYGGVSFHKSSKSWRAYVGAGISRVEIGYFKTEEKAYLAVCEYKKSKNN